MLCITKCNYSTLGDKNVFGTLLWHTLNEETPGDLIKLDVDVSIPGWWFETI